jgi:hypothetical protein
VRPRRSSGVVVRPLNFTVRRRMWRLLPLLLVVACSPLRGCVESQFELAPGSRLPRWFSVPSPGSNVNVKLTFYTPGDPLIELFVDGKEVSAVSGPYCWHPVMDAKRNERGGFKVGGPDYMYIRAKGIIEVLEFPGGPVFRVSDDPALMSAALAAKRCAKE